MLRPQFREEIKRWGYLILFLYAVLLLVSHFYLYERGKAEPREDSDKKVVEVMGQRLAYLEWGGADPSLAPLILLHGSPGTGARDWEQLAPELAVPGRRVIAIDRWGYGASQLKVEDYSFDADRKAVLGLMDRLGIKRAHVAGWSYGGGPAILLGGRDGERILSVSLIAALGIQRGEGSGSYMVEHWKYSLLYLLTNWVPEVIPHFGLLGPRSARNAFVRDFMDCDQRTIESSLTTMRTPLLIIHGKKDPFVAAWVAQEHHRLRPESRLVLLDESHFFPFKLGDPDFELASDELITFLAAADRGEASELYGERNETSREDMRALWYGGLPIRGYKPWWIVVMAGMALGFFIPRTSGLVAGLAGGLLVIDLMTGVGGIILGAIIKRGDSRSRFHKAAVVCVCGLVGLIPAVALLPAF
jgi:pimeloyl-ACP methyl ester carboxylesterase